MRFLLTAALIAVPGLSMPGAACAETLQDALAEAYRNNPALEGARFGALAADEAPVQARAAYLPQVSVSAVRGAADTRVEAPDGLGGTVRSDSSLSPSAVSIDVEQPLYTGGRRAARSTQADAEAGAGRENLRAAENNVLLAVITAYVDVRRDEESVRIRQGNVDLLRRQREEAEARFEVGDITRTDVAQSGARLAGAEAGLATARAALEASRARYVELVGRPPGTLDAPPPPPPLPSSLSEAVERALRASPEVRNAQLNARAAHAQIEAERADLLPQISLRAGWSHTEDQTGPDIEREEASAGARVSVPLFEGGLAASRMRGARYTLAQARQGTESARRAMTTRITAAWNDVQATARVVDSSREQVSASELAYEGVRQERTVGLRTNIDVLDALQELQDARLQQAEAERNHYVAAHALLAAAGELNGETLAVNTSLYDADEHHPAPAPGAIPDAPPPLPLRGRT